MYFASEAELANRSNSRFFITKQHASVYLDLAVSFCIIHFEVHYPTGMVFSKQFSYTVSKILQKKKILPIFTTYGKDIETGLHLVNLTREIFVIYKGKSYRYVVHI